MLEIELLGTDGNWTVVGHPVAPITTRIEDEHASVGNWIVPGIVVESQGSFDVMSGLLDSHRTARWRAVVDGQPSTFDGHVSALRGTSATIIPTGAPKTDAGGGPPGLT